MVVTARSATIKTSHVPPKPRITVDWEWITPEIAEQYLGENLERNRNLRAGWVDTLVAILKEGGYIPTHQGIAMDSEGNMVDGQHRLTAILRSGVGAWILVARGLTKEALLCIDLHVKRQPHDQIKLIDLKINPDTSDVAIAKMMKTGARAGGNVQHDPNLALISTAQVYHFLLHHWEAVRFAQSHCARGRRTRSAPIRAAIARAYYHVDREKLHRFMVVFGNRLADNPKEHAAVNFRTWVDDERNRHIVSGGRGARAELFMITVGAIQAFLKGNTGRNFKPVEEDPWPLPEES